MCQWIRIKEELKKLYETKSFTIAYKTNKKHLFFYVASEKRVASALKNSRATDQLRPILKVAEVPGTNIFIPVECSCEMSKVKH